MSDLLSSFGAHGNPLVHGGLVLMIVGGLVAWLRRVPSMAFAMARRRLVYTVEVTSSDQCFGWVQEWLAARDDAKKSRDLTAIAKWDGEGTNPNSGPPRPNYIPKKATIALLPGPGLTVIRYRGTPMVIHRTRRENQYNGMTSFLYTITLRFIGATRETIEGLLDEIVKFSERPPDGVPIYDTDGSIGGWCQSSVIAKRPAESLALADGLFDDILADMRNFLGSAKWYADRGVPYRRGYLLQGPPGTGKTTLAPVLAGELGLSVSTLSLGDPSMSDAGVRSLFRSLPARSILVIEDIDCVFVERKAASEKVGVTLSGLLNVLDGVGSQEGRILFLTTNHPERLDPALTRPGRVDRKIELGNATWDQAKQMFAWFYRDRSEDIESLAVGFADGLPNGTSPATIQEHLVRHRDDPENAAREPIGEKAIAEETSVVRLSLNGHCHVGA